MTSADRLPSTRWIIACAILYAVLTLAFLGDRPIKRVQEARVLETSRQMLDSHDWHGWLVPKLNGEPRLRKPPLSYWYTAASYRAFGEVNEWAGRLPTVAIGWATVVVTFFFGKDLLGRRGGFLAAAVLATSAFFLRFIRSAETDIPAMLGVMIACWGIVRGIGITAAGQSKGNPLWFHFAACGLALSAMSKGPQALFPLVTLGLLCWALQSRAPVVRFLLSGAPITALMLIIPWFAYALADPAAGQVGEEIVVVTSGSNHRGIFLEYIPTVLHMLLPWTPVLVAALFAKSFRRKPIDLQGRVAVCTLMGVALPLCVTLNVQAHYLIPTLPPFALIIAWAITRALEAIEESPRTAAGDKVAKLAESSWGVAVWTAMIVGVAILIIEFIRGHHQLHFAAAAAGVSFALAGAVLWVRGKGRSASSQTLLWTSLMVFAMPMVGGWWAPEFNRDYGRELAATVRANIGTHPLIGWGKLGDITLSFNLRQAIPWLTTEAALRETLARHPDAVIVTERDDRGGTPLPAIGLRERFRGAANENTLIFFDQAPLSTSAPATRP